MTTNTIVTCDFCEKELNQQNDIGYNYCIKIENEMLAHKGRKGLIVGGTNDAPLENSPLHFCNIRCLAHWSKNND